MFWSLMALTDITRDAVLAAVAEFDDLGQDEFLKLYKFGPARTFHLELDGKRYDSKAIAGVAHRHLPGQQALRPEDFSGGQATVVRLLRNLDFRVVEVRPPAWTWDELVLVCDLMAAKGWTRLLEEQADVKELSEFLQHLQLHPAEVRGDRFRTAGAVARKGENIRQWHEGFAHQENNGGKRDKEVHDAFIADPEGMHEMALALRRELPTAPPEELAFTVEETDDGVSEGGLLQRRYLARERNRPLRRKKINEVLAEHGRLACEVCSFDFKRTYGEHGAGFAEVHHVVPLHVSGSVKTRTADLAILCSNCHRMIHYRPKWLTPAELRALIVG
jgi:5-methylcytosine-specific restriction protein A